VVAVEACDAAFFGAAGDDLPHVVAGLRRLSTGDVS
jgi:hypothetical protein